jgi:hypothetical protein
MVIPIKIAMLHPKRGFIKLEDAVVVPDSGWEGPGEKDRNSNVAQI